jgi:RNA-directed DNA polymerase
MSILESLATKFLISQKELATFVNSAPYRYKVYTIPKRNGSGVRIIAQPTDVLKVMQKMVLEEFFHDLPVHECATAYVENKSIKTNAEAHAKNQYLLKVDFSDFFPSMRPADLIEHISIHKGKLTPEDENTVKKLFFWAKKNDPTHRLSIGAPSSPFISNTLLYEFDCMLHAACWQLQVTYTRYADDLTLTSNVKGALSDALTLIKKFVEEIPYPRLSINHKKTVSSSKKHNRHVTGLVLANHGKVSLGREKKRLIKALIFKADLETSSQKELNKVKGLIAFSKHIEPTFYISLIQKYGKSKIAAIEAFQPDSNNTQNAESV